MYTLIQCEAPDVYVTVGSRTLNLMVHLALIN